jgi:hypothetical protein
MSARADGDLKTMDTCQGDGFDDVPFVSREDDCGGVAGGDSGVEEAARAGFFVGVAIGVISEDGLHGF